MTSLVQICNSYPLLGQLRSNDDVKGSLYVSFYICVLLLCDRDMGYVPKCSPRQDSSNDMLLDLFRWIRELGLGWPEFKVTKWPFGVTKYLYRYESIRLWQNQWSTLNSAEVIDEKLSPRETDFFRLTWPGRSTVALNSSTRTPSDWKCPLVFDAKLYHTQERDGAGVTPPPPPPGALSVGEKGGAGEG